MRGIRHYRKHRASGFYFSALVMGWGAVGSNLSSKLARASIWFTATWSCREQCKIHTRKYWRGVCLGIAFGTVWRQKCLYLIRGWRIGATYLSKAFLTNLIKLLAIGIFSP